MILRKDDLNKNPKKNDYSIGLVITLGNLALLLSGDIENKTIQRIEEYTLPEIIDFIKTPHHTSESSDKLLEYIDDYSCEIACSTTYKNGNTNLPNNNVINLYKKKARNFYLVGRKTNEYDEKYGVIFIQWDIINKKFEIVLEGNACTIYEDNGKEFLFEN